MAAFLSNSEQSKFDIIDMLDLHPFAFEENAMISYLILREARYNDQLINAVLSEYSAHDKDQNRQHLLRQELISNTLTDSPHPYSSACRLALGVLPGPDTMDGILADYYFSWAKDIGVSEEKVLEIFQAALRRRDA